MITGKHITLRHLALADEALLLDSFVDWPGGKTRPSTIRKFLEGVEYDHLDIERPVTSESAFRESFAVEVNGAFVGHSVHVVDGTHVDIIQQTILPDYRGTLSGHDVSIFTELNILLKNYGFNVLGIETCRFPILLTSTGVQNHVLNRDMYEPDAHEITTDSGNKVCYVTLTKAKYEEYLLTSPDKDWPFTE